MENTLTKEYLAEAKSFLSRTISKTKYDARERRGLAFEITIDDVLALLIKQQGKCALTGDSLEFTRGGTYKYGTNPNACTIDRIHNSEGYKSWNIQLTCWKANCIRGELSLSELKEFCQKVVDNVQHA